MSYCHPYLTLPLTSWDVALCPALIPSSCEVGARSTRLESPRVDSPLPGPRVELEEKCQWLLCYYLYLSVSRRFHPRFPLLQDLRRKAARLVAAKCTLAARVDSFHESTEGKVRGGR